MRSATCFLLLMLLLAATAFPAPKNLVDNPSFSAAGEEPVPKWLIRRIARKTEFSVEGGRLVAVRGPGASFSADSCYQKLYLPEGATALRVELLAGCERLDEARVLFRFQDRTGAALGRSTIFRISGTRKASRLEKDVRLPPETHDLEISIELPTEGRLTIDDVSVTAIDEEVVRPEARLVTVEGLVAVEPAGEAAVPETEIRIPVPAVTATQCPVALHIEAEPAGRILAGAVEREDGREVLALRVGPADPEEKITIHWTARVVVCERDDYRSLPDPIPLVPSRHLNRRMLPWVELASGAEPERADALLAEAAGDLGLLGRAVAGAAVGEGPKRAARVAHLFRVCDVAARPVALIPIGETPALTFAVEAFQRELGWLRFPTGAEGPWPGPSTEAVCLAAAPPDSFESPEAPTGGPEVKVAPAEFPGFEGGAGFLAREVDSVVLPQGATTDLIAALAKAWERPARELDPNTGCRIPARKVSLSGKAGKLKKHLDRILGAGEED